MALLIVSLIFSISFFFFFASPAHTQIVDSFEALITDWYKIAVHVSAPCVHCIDAQRPNVFMFPIELCSKASLQVLFCPLSPNPPCFYFHPFTPSFIQYQHTHTHAHTHAYTPSCVNVTCTLHTYYFHHRPTKPRYHIVFCLFKLFVTLTVIFTHALSLCAVSSYFF